MAVFRRPTFIVKDAHGNVLQDGDSVTVIKDLKVKGSSAVLKVGTKIKGIRLIESDDGSIYIHGIKPDNVNLRDVGFSFDCSEKKDGFEDITMLLSSKYVGSLFGDMVEGQEYGIFLRSLIVGSKPADRAVGFGSFIFHKKPDTINPS